MSIFKEPLSGPIAGQLKTRQDIIGKENRSPQDLVYLNSKKAWVNLRSSVDIIVPGASNSKNLAHDHILSAGTLNPFGGLKSGVGQYAMSAYSHQTYNSSTKTLENNKLGIRPMPGITNISVQNKGAYGSLRTATVNFQCWDINQLDILEQLYMRPGYTVLLEWGWNPYIDNNGVLKNTNNQDTKFFNRKDVNLQSYLSELRTKSLFSFGNYDAMFGYVMNYGWKFRADGGYDCHTEIISTGELLESYKINFSGAPIVKKDSAKPSQVFADLTYTNVDDVRSEYSKNMLSGIVFETYSACKLKSDQASFPNGQGVGFFDYKYGNKTGRISYAVNNIAVEIPITEESTDGTEVIPTDTSGTGGNVMDPGKDIYITLESFVGILNNFILLQNTSDSNNKPIMNLSVNDRPDVGKQDHPLNCLVHPLQISVDPAVCVINNSEFIKNLSKIKITTEPVISTDEKPKPGDLLRLDKPAPKKFDLVRDLNPARQKELGEANKAAGATDEIKQESESSQTSYLGFCALLRPFYENTNGRVRGNQSEIYLNLRMLYNLAIDSTLKSQDPAEKEGIQLLPYIKNILALVQNATGNVNNFEIIIDGQTGYIIDLNISKPDETVEPFTFKISGRDSIIKDINFESQIFADQATIIAISAQSDAGKLGLENSSMVAFNKGLTDRMISKKDSPISSYHTLTEQVEGYVTALANIKLFFQSMNNLTDAKLKSDQISLFKSSLTDVIAFATSIYKSQGNKYKSILPTKVSLTFDGIGGIIIGNIFNIDKTFTPSSYKGDGSGIDLQYIVTNVKHEIGSDGQWKTTIEGNPFIPDTSSKGLDDGLKELDTTYNVELRVTVDPITGEVKKNFTVTKVKSYPITSPVVKANLKLFDDELIKQGMTNPILRQAALAKAMTESAGYNFKEDIDYHKSTPDRMRIIFKSRLGNRNKISDEYITNLKNDPEKMIEFLYGPNSGTGLGNDQPGDAVKYRGRGFVGITGKANYKAVGDKIGVDLLKHPELLENPAVAAKASAAFLVMNTKPMAKKMKMDLKNPTKDQAVQLMVNTIGGTGVRNLKIGGTDVFSTVYTAATGYSTNPVITSIAKW